MKKFIAALMIFVCVSGFADPMKLEPAQQKKFNTFFSNFSESNVPSFTSPTDEIMLNFALSHIYKNKFKTLKVTKDKLSVIATPEQVNTSSIKYFGKAPSAHKEKEYTMPIADGEAFVFSQLDKIEDIGNNFFKAEGTIYTTGSGGTPDVHATPEAWKKAGEEVEAISRFSAKIKSEGERYILVEYSVVDIQTDNQSGDQPDESAAEPFVFEGDVLMADVFDWNRLDEKGKLDLVGKIKELWRSKGAETDKNAMEAKAIIEKMVMGDQANVMESACKAAGIDPVLFQKQ